MTDENAPVHRRKVSAREHLAGVKGARKWIQTLSDEHLLRTQSPIRDEPVNPEPATGGPASA